MRCRTPPPQVTLQAPQDPYPHAKAAPPLSLRPLVLSLLPLLPLALLLPLLPLVLQAASFGPSQWLSRRKSRVAPLPPSLLLLPLLRLLPLLLLLLPSTAFWRLVGGSFNASGDAIRMSDQDACRPAAVAGVAHALNGRRNLCVR